MTPIGGLLGRTGLDELPCLICVLWGDMSFVGPRAALPFEVERYSKRERRRLELKPGITGYWQVYGRARGAFSLESMAALDLEYGAKRSFALDLKILLLSVPILLRGEVPD